MGEITPRLIAHANQSQAVVKSAGRAFEILEFFADYRCPATSVEIAESLGYPQSSTAALLKSLVSLGYLSYDPLSRTYLSTSRVSLLGHWINPSLIAPGPILQAMQNANAKAREAVVLVARNGLYVQYVHVEQSPQPNARRIGMSHFRPLATSAAGHCFLSVMPELKVPPLIRRINAESEPDDIVDIKQLTERLAQVRRDGYALVYGQKITCATLAVNIPTSMGREHFVMAISSDQGVMDARAPDFLEILNQAKAECRTFARSAA